MDEQLTVLQQLLMLTFQDRAKSLKNVSSTSLDLLHGRSEREKRGLLRYS